MKPIVLVTGVIAIFGAGFVAGYYRSADSGAQTDTASATQRDERPSLAAKTPRPGKADSFLAHHAPGSDGSARPPIQIPQQHPENGASLPSPALPPHERIFSVEEQVQWETQQREAKEAGLAQLDAMIQSMETAGLPAEEIKHFREHREARAKAPIDELPASNSPLPELTPEELRADFAASLEQTDIPEGERKAMLEAFSQQFEPTDGNLLDDSFSAVLPPH